MPWATKKPCATPGCAGLCNRGIRFCERCQPAEDQRRRDYERKRGSAAFRGYGHKWRKKSKAFLRANPWCSVCGKAKATVVDHKIPHRGDPKLFWDESNWDVMCKPCHDRKTATEDGGFGHRGRGGKSLQPPRPRPNG